MENPKYNLTDFPYEVLFNILLNADPKDIASYCQTSKRASEICKDQSFWRVKLWKDYGKQEQVEEMTWQKQYQSGPIRVINSHIAAGNGYYAIIDDRGDLYIAGRQELVDPKFSKTLTKVVLESKAISVITGQGRYDDCPFIGVVTVNGKVYVLENKPYTQFTGYIGGILVPDIIACPTLSTQIKPRELNFPRSGKIVKINRENKKGQYGVIMDSGLAYLVGGRNKEPILIRHPSDRKIVDLIIPGLVARLDSNIDTCYFLDNYGDVYFIYIDYINIRNLKEKLNFPDPIKQLSASNDINAALSIKGDVYTWGYDDIIGDFHGWSDYDLYGGTKKPIFYFKAEIYMDHKINPDVYKIDIPAHIKSISTGYGTVAAVTTNGSVYVWGSNKCNRLFSKNDQEKLMSSGEMHTVYEYNTPFLERPLEIKLKSKIKSISMGNEFTIALTEDGILNYWGDQDMAPNDTI